MERATALADYLALEDALDGPIYMTDAQQIAAVMLLLKFIHDHPALHDVPMVRKAVKQQMRFVSCTTDNAKVLEVMSRVRIDTSVLEAVAE